MSEQETPSSPWTTLTTRERDVAMLLALGHTNREISIALGISIKTVDTHRGHIIKKLACRNNVGLLRFMLREGVAS
jgi:DNA-binding CsgD family transcriptional regulator